MRTLEKAKRSGTLVAMFGFALVVFTMMASTTNAAAVQSSLPINPCFVRVAQLTPLETVYVGSSLTVGNFLNAQVVGLGQPNSNGASPVLLNVTYQGHTWNGAMLPGQTEYFRSNVLQNVFFGLFVNQTRVGLSSYQRWAQMQWLQYTLVCLPRHVCTGNQKECM